MRDMGAKNPSGNPLKLGVQKTHIDTVEWLFLEAVFFFFTFASFHGLVFHPSHNYIYIYIFSGIWPKLVKKTHTHKHTNGPTFCRADRVDSYFSP